MIPSMYIHSNKGPNIRAISVMYGNKEALKAEGLYICKQYHTKDFVACMIMLRDCPVAIYDKDDKLYVLVDKLIPWLNKLKAEGIKNNRD